MICSVRGGLERYQVSLDEIRQIEPSLTGQYYAGFYCPGDATGDIHKFTVGLAQVTMQQGVRYIFGRDVHDVQLDAQQVQLSYRPAIEDPLADQPMVETLHADAVLICGGVRSYQLARQVGDRVIVYPVKGYSITVNLQDEQSQKQAPWVSLLDESAKIVTSRLGTDRLRIAGTAEFNGYNRDIRHDRIQPLVRWVQRNFDISTESVVPWAGLRPMMPNMMPVIRQGQHPRVFYNTGHGHLGWTLSAATALMISQEIAQHYPVTG